MEIEVIYARPACQDLVKLTLPPPLSVKQALEASGLLQKYALDLQKLALGVFGKRVALADFLNDQDRLEIYRPIAVDPMVKRALKVKGSNLPRRCR